MRPANKSTQKVMPSHMPSIIGQAIPPQQFIMALTSLSRGTLRASLPHGRDAARSLTLHTNTYGIKKVIQGKSSSLLRRLFFMLDQTQALARGARRRWVRERLVPRPQGREGTIVAAHRTDW